MSYKKYKHLKDVFNKINDIKIHKKKITGGLLEFENKSEPENIAQPYRSFKKTLDTWVKMIFFRQQYNDEQRAKYDFDNKAREETVLETNDDNIPETQTPLPDDSVYNPEDSEVDDLNVLKLKNKYVK